MKAFAALTAPVCLSLANGHAKSKLRVNWASVAALIFLFSLAGQEPANAQTSHFRNPRPGGTGTVPVFIGMGDPLPGIANNFGDLTNFSNGLLNFQETET